MLRTLHYYLSRDLLKVAALATAAFTVMLTVLAIVEPLRKRGLAAEQVAALFGYTLPVMLTLTLPVAALFAATIVYGRFSQDNELLACRASGVSTIGLLRPALVLGAVVTAATLLLSNFVTPRMAERGEQAVRANIRKIAYHQLRTQAYVQADKYTVHADYVDQASDTLYGIVAIEARTVEVARIVLARSATVDFPTFGQEAYVSIYPVDPVGPIGGRSGEALVHQGQVVLEWLPFRMPRREKPAMYTWDRLVRTLRRPSLHGAVEAELLEARQKLGFDLLSRDVVEAVSAGRPYEKLKDPLDSYVIRAASARMDSEGTAVLFSGQAGQAFQRVEVTTFSGGKPSQIVQADSGKVRATLSELERRPLVTIELRDNVVVRVAGELLGRPQMPGEWVRGQINMPQDVLGRLESINLEDIYERPRELTSDPKILRRLALLKTDTVPKIQSAIVAEMHGRIAYGASCFLMVAMGAAMGLILRGGQIISAFAIAVVPAAFVIIMVLMGQQMIRNPDVAAGLGMGAIWGGVAALAAADAAVYAHLLRR